jgi:NAD/NADP octopine/nopaline dehydrogenase, alpha-helical domain
MTYRACVLGAGNSAHVTAGLVASLPDWECHVYAPRKDRAELWRAGIERGGIRVCYGHDDDNLVVQGSPVKVSKQAADVIPGCSVLILCLPAQAFEENLRAAAPYVDVGAAIGTICASNGFDWCVDDAMARAGRSPGSYTVFALQNLPWACRVSEYGVAADVLGTKPFMELVGRPASALPDLSEVLGRLLRLPCPPVASGFLGVGLSNMTQVIHPAVMYDNFGDWDGETPYDEVPLFYQGLSDKAADNMSQVSDEILAVRAALEKHAPSLDLSVVHHVWDWCLRAYEKYITDDSTLRTRFSSNRAYVGLTCPMHPAPDQDGFIPDFEARYLTEDVPHNLVPLKGVALLADVKTPTVDRLLVWCQQVMGKKYLVDGALDGPDLADTFAPQRYGFRTLDDLPEIRDAK